LCHNLIFFSEKWKYKEKKNEFFFDEEKKTEILCEEKNSQQFKKIKQPKKPS